MSDDDRPDGNGIHHVTALATDPARNRDFYERVLGLRLVKTTVNYDDPSTHHLYYGSAVGLPGTIVTFFPRPGSPRGVRGLGQATTTGFRVAADAVGFWRDRLTEAGTVTSGVESRFGREGIRFLDPDSLELEIVGDDGPAPAPWDGGGVPPETALRGLIGVSLTVAEPEATAELLRDLLGHRDVGREDGVVRLAAGKPQATFVDLRSPADAAPGRVAAGTVHHVAFRARDDAEQERLRDAVRARGLRVTEVLDRQYFRSIYFREPGGVLFEVATDGPGFTVDEPASELGAALRLPAWLEPDRNEIVAALPPLRQPS